MMTTTPTKPRAAARKPRKRKPTATSPTKRRRAPTTTTTTEEEEEETQTKRRPPPKGRPRAPLPDVPTPNPFAVWMSVRGIHVEEVALMLDVSIGTVYGWRRGNRPPKRAMATRIAKLTDGVVGAESWD